MNLYIIFDLDTLELLNETYSKFNQINSNIYINWLVLLIILIMVITIIIEKTNIMCMINAIHIIMNGSNAIKPCNLHNRLSLHGFVY